MFLVVSMYIGWIGTVIEQGLERGVLYCNCSILNTMIAELQDRFSCGFLLDWEFAGNFTKRGEYSVGGTVCPSLYHISSNWGTSEKGTLPFMSINIFHQLAATFTNSAAMTLQSIHKMAYLTWVFINDSMSICHSYADNVKSLLYVLVWIIIMCDIPLGHECRNIGHEKTFFRL